MPGRPRPTPERFWSQVDKTDACWIWTGPQSTTGYGKFSVGRKQQFKAHRFAWFLKHGVHPTGHLLHSCDTPLCVRPDHLRQGNDRENHLDMMRRTTAEYCRHGVERTQENTYIRANGTRKCRCRAQQARISDRATWRDPAVAARLLVIQEEP